MFLPKPTSPAVTMPKIVLCDREKTFCLRFYEYLRKQRLPYEITTYFHASVLGETTENMQIAVLVISEKEYGEKLSLPAYTRVLVLNESGTVTGGEGVRSISKYRPPEEIVRVIKQLCAEALEDPRIVSPGRIRTGKRMRIIGVYTPIHRALQTTMAVALGQLLARKSPALYMNFESCSGLSTMLRRHFEGSVTDLIYFNTCAREKVALRLQLMTQRMGDLHFLPPAVSFAELRSIRGDQWLDLFKTIEDSTDFSYLILDLSEQTDGLLDILRYCDDIITITDNGSVFSESKMEQYRCILKEENYEDVFAKTRRWHLPVFRDLPDSLEDLTRGELADYIQMHFFAEEDKGLAANIF